MSAPMTKTNMDFLFTHRGLCLSIYLICILSNGVCVAERTLKLAQVLYRHGNRSPATTYPNDLYAEESWPGGFGQLTEKGMRQHLELGRWLRKRYITDLPFLSASYERTELTVVSTFRDRTVMSALSNLQGLYPSRYSGEVEGESLWRPIPVHSLPTGCDDYLHSSHIVCPRLKRLQQLTRTPMAEKYIADNQEFFDTIAMKAGLTSTTLSIMDELADALKFQRRDGRTLPDWVTDDVYQKLQATTDYKFLILYYNGTTEYKRLSAGPLIDKLVSNIKNYVIGGNGKTKLFMYSAHDSTLATLFGGLGFIFTTAPPTASCLLVELYQENDGSYSVDLYYRNTTDETHPLKPMAIPGCIEHCPLEIFNFLTHKVIPVDHKTACEIVAEGSQCRTTAFLLIAAFVAICLLLIILRHTCKLSLPRRMFQLLILIYVIAGFLVTQWYCLAEIQSTKS